MAKGTEAAMRPVPEAQDLPRLPRDVEAVGVGKMCPVAVGRGDAQLHYLPCSYCVPAQLEVLQGDPGDQGDRRFVAQRLLDGVAQEFRIAPELVKLVGVGQEQIDGVANEVPGRYVPCQQ